MVRLARSDAFPYNSGLRGMVHTQFALLPPTKTQPNVSGYPLTIPIGGDPHWRDAFSMEATMLRDCRASEMAESAITLPIVLLVLMLVINGLLAGYTGLSAAAAADAGARAGARTNRFPEVSANNAAWTSIVYTRMGGRYQVGTQVDDQPGGAVKVFVAWRYSSMLSGFCKFFGGDCKPYFEGYSVSTHKKEGW
jgi:hypothetical protein